MSGIFGLFDREGPDIRSIERAAKVSDFRGVPEIHLVDSWALGAFRGDTDSEGVVRGPSSLLVADARVDALLDGYEAKFGAVRGIGTLEDVLEAAGPAGLRSTAADFAVARYDLRDQSLLLARDAFALRPLYWARRGARAGFASDPEILIALGLAGWDPDPQAVISWLFERAEIDHRTCLRGISRVRPGRWVRFDAVGSVEGGRWFRPEDVLPDEGLSLEEAAHEARETLVAAVTARASGRNVALLLSGGRDSSSVAVALAEAGIKATCVTYVLQAQGVQSESALGMDLARSLGHEWVELPIQPRIEPEKLPEIVRETGGPLRSMAAPIQLMQNEVVRRLGADTVLEGEGGDLLFSAFPVAVLDLIRGGRFRLALEAVRNYQRHWSYPYSVTAKVVLRALAPRELIALRERRREHPGWLIRPQRQRLRHDRSDVGYLRDMLRDGVNTSAEAPQRILSFAGASLAWPLVDLRVLRLGLRLPARLRVPVPGPKPVLGESFLKTRERDLVKLPLDGFARSLAESYLLDFPTAFARDSLAARLGLVRGDALSQAADPRWAWDAANVLGVDAWLRQVEAERGR